MSFPFPDEQFRISSYVDLITQIFYGSLESMSLNILGLKKIKEMKIFLVSN